MARISGIAKELGISPATVSRALARPEMVARGTRERIIAKAKEMGIELPECLTLIGSQQLIGVMVADLTNSFSAGVLKAITTLAENDGTQVLLGVTNENPITERRILADFNCHDLTGLIAMPTGNPGLPPIECRNIVAVDRPFLNRDTKCALINNQKVVNIAYDHLYVKGHQNIVYISGKSTLFTFRERIEAAYSCDYVEPIELDALEYTDLYTKAFELTNILLARHSNRPTAILTANNAITAGVVYALSLRNVQMPRDISLVSIGDPEWCRFYPCPITTVKLPEEELGVTAYEMLKYDEQKICLIEPMLLPRSSS